MNPQDKRAAGILLEEQRLKLLVFVPKQDVDAFAGLYDEAERMNDIRRRLILEEGVPPQDLPSMDWLARWLDTELSVGASRDGWRSNQVVDVMKGQRDERTSSERYMDPQYGPEERHGWKS